MKLVLLTFGDNLENHYQATFSILSFLQSPSISGVYVVTDNPDYYRHFADRIQIIAVDAAQLQEWKGPHDFFWRIKIKALETVINQHPDDDILYVDSDTFLASDLSEIAQKIANGHTFMHDNEGALCRLDSKSERNMWRSLKNRTFQGRVIDESVHMWNAGVIGFPAKKAREIITLALALCDDMCATSCPRRLVEQFAFSLALSATQPLTHCRDVILHYWGNKPEWNHEIKYFLLHSHLHQLSVADEITKIAELNYQAIPIVKKERSLKKALLQTCHSLFRPKMVRYFGESAR